MQNRTITHTMFKLIKKKDYLDLLLLNVYICILLYSNLIICPHIKKRILYTNY